MEDLMEDGVLSSVISMEDLMEDGVLFNETHRVFYTTLNTRGCPGVVFGPKIPGADEMR
jgi:hypothetical protein